MLEEAGIEFNVIVSGIDEDLLKDQISNLPFEQQVVHLAKAKAQSVSMENTDKVVIGGDQMCVLEDTVFNKPGSKEKAIETQTHLFLPQKKNLQSPINNKSKFVACL